MCKQEYLNKISLAVSVFVSSPSNNKTFWEKEEEIIFEKYIINWMKS